MMRQLLKYPGSKFRSADWIISHFPQHHSYVEPFFGSGGVFFNKTASNIETINDLDRNVTNLFEVIQTDPEQLAEAVFAIPYARQVFDDAFAATPTSPVEKAARFLILNNMGHGFRTTGERVGWKIDVQGRERSYAVKYWNGLPDKIIENACRLKEVQIENRDYASIIERFNHPNVLIYADPPYVLATRLRLRVTDVWAERLQDIMLDPPGKDNQIVREGCLYGCDFIALWQSTIKPADLPRYGWDANPWVWVIEFERIEVDKQ